jgi:hypothetical protein
MLIMPFTARFMVILTKYNHPYYFKIPASAANLDNHQTENYFFTYM